MRRPLTPMRRGGVLLGLLVATLPMAQADATPFRSAWHPEIERTWIGPEFWANRLQDWRIANGRLECTTPGPGRNVGLLTRRIGPKASSCSISVRCGRIGGAGPGWAGFRVGAKGRVFAAPELRDHRDDVLRGKGLDCGITTDGQLFIGSPGRSGAALLPERGLPRKDWRVTHVDSTQGGDESPSAALDGNPETFWHSTYGKPPYPHEFQIDLGVSADVCGFVYVPRRSQPIGRIKGYKFYVSPDGHDWGEPVANGEFPNSAEPQDVRFTAKRGRFIRLHALSDHVRRPAAAIAEFYVLDTVTAAQATPSARDESAPTGVGIDDLELRLRAERVDGNYQLTLSAHDPQTGRELARAAGRSKPDDLVGAVALVSHSPRAKRSKDAPRFWFRNWTVTGDGLTEEDDEAFGPILWSQYTLSRGVLKLTAQMPPLGPHDAQQVRLELRQGGDWRQAAVARIDPLARTARFRVGEWPSGRDVPYRLAYALTAPEGNTRDVYWPGTIRRDPVDKRTVVVAAFTGNADYAFPNADVVRHVETHDPDLLFFSGDNIYEQVGGFGVERAPLDRACLDYLRKWYCYGWAYRDLLRCRPCVSIPDDHDVYQGNIWGHGGRKATRDHNGGYTMPAEWVNMVQRTQTSHLPDPFDATPVDQGITVYYCALTYGRISFAILEDRKFKTGPAGLVPQTPGGRPDHVTAPGFDPRTADVAEARLLGERQLLFLRDWAADWRGAEMKATLSQTVFAGAATHHGGKLTPLVADYDANGWPQTGRNRALGEIRRAFGFMIGGDQHLATLIHHGIDTWNDAGWSFLVPSIANLYLRAWMPDRQPHRTLAPGMPPYTGEHVDGFGNKITVWAATNPGPVGRQPAWLHDKKPGYGIVRFDKTARTIGVECWPRWADPLLPQADTQQYAGWPRTIEQLDNDGREAAAYLPTVRVTGARSPVVQIIAEPDGTIVYTLRTKGPTFPPKVFRPGTYTVRVGEPDTDSWQVFHHVTPLAPGQAATLDVRL